MDLKKTNKEFKVVKFEEEQGFVIKKNKEKIIVYEEDVIDKLISDKFNHDYKEILYMILNYNNSDDVDSSDEEILRIKIEELRVVLLKEYRKFLDKAVFNKYLKMLLILESKIDIKVRIKGVCR